MLAQSKASESTLIAGHGRPQYHYFYGSVEDSLTVSVNDNHDQDSLLGEKLVNAEHDSEYDIHSLGNGDATPKAKWNFSGLGCVLLVVILAASLSLAVLLVPVLAPPQPMAQSLLIPFETVNRADYGDPVDGFIDLDLIHPSLLSDSEPHTFIFPFPTGAFWTNLVVPSPNPAFSYPAVVYPYAYMWSKSALQISYPYSHRLEDHNHRKIADLAVPDLTLTTAEEAFRRYVTKFDPLSVTLRFATAKGSRWSTPLVQGSPYTTLKYFNATPIIKATSTFKSLQCPRDDAEDFHDFVDDRHDEHNNTRRQLFGVCSVDDTKEGVTKIRGVQFMFQTQEGDYWIMFSSEPINLEFDTITRNTIRSVAPFTGVVRLAYIPVEYESDTSTIVSTGLRRLIYHAGEYPTGAKVGWSFHSTQTNTKLGHKKSQDSQTSGRKGTISFSFATQPMTDSSYGTPTKGLLMLALPHHARALPTSVQLDSKGFDLTYHCIKGPMTPIVGSTWSYDEPLLDLRFDDTEPDVDAGVRQVILKQIEDDITRVLPTLSENVYGFGKQIARLAQMAHIASKIEGESRRITERATSILASYLEKFFSGDVIDGLVYDTKMGGIVSTNGLLSKEADFGNGRYNDHHFHYGYILYASAILGKLDPTFVERFGAFVDAIFCDVTYSSNGYSQQVAASDSFFPMTRHKSWFDGHSFATGMFPFGDGKSQESSSEAVNCYYGAYLWSLARTEGGIVGSGSIDFSRLLLAMEVRSTQTYWHMLPKSALGNSTTDSILYSPTFAEHYMVGNVGMLDVTANTWFSTDPLHVHMINVIPITAVTGFLLHPNFVEHEYNYLMGSRDEVEMAWRGYTVSVHSLFDSNEAWEEAQDLVSYELDAAVSKSEVLYFISQRPDFNVSVPFVEEDDVDTPEVVPVEVLCSSHSSCSAAAIMGKCCPTGDGIYLWCCGLVTTPANDKSESKDSEDSCESHPKCAEGGVTGKCCPSPDGISLDCCDG